MRHRRLAVALVIGVLASGVGVTAVAADDSSQDAKDTPQVVAPTPSAVSKGGTNSPKDIPRHSAKDTTIAPRVGKEAPIEEVQRLIPDSVWGGAYVGHRRYVVMVTDPSIVPVLSARFSGSMDFVVVKYSLKELERQMTVVFGARKALEAKGIKMQTVDGDEKTNNLYVGIEGPISANARAEILKVVPGAPLRLASEKKQVVRLLPAVPPAP